MLYKSKIEKLKRSSPVSRWSFSAFKYLSLIAASVITILPIIVIFLGSFKTGAEFNSSGVFDFPKEWIFDNYVTAFTRGRMALGFVNTFFLIIASGAGSIMVGTMASYVLHRFDFPGKKFIRNLFLWIILIPTVTTEVTRFQIVNALGLYNTRMVLVVLSMGTDIIAIYIYLQFLESISRSLDESAIIEGAGYFTVYFRIIMPLLKPATATVFIIKSIGMYNDFYKPFLYMPKQSLQVISTALYKFKGPYGSQWEVICAGVMIAIIPTLVIFLALQKHIYNGLVQGSVKQ